MFCYYFIIVMTFKCLFYHLFKCYQFIHRFRVFCHWLCNHSNFGNIILCCIMFSSAMLAAENPLQANDDLNKVSSSRSSTRTIW